MLKDNESIEDLVAQLVEQYTFNVWALGSSPSRITKKPPARWLFSCAMRRMLLTPLLRPVP